MNDLKARQESVCFDRDLIARYDGRGPRYTSYPTAVQFSESLTPEDYQRAAVLSNSNPRPLSLYVHIPFCHSLCYYCGCNKIVTRNKTRVNRYLDVLYREIELQSDLFTKARAVEQLHFGGGTPTYLEPDTLAELVGLLGDAFTFASPEQREFSIEVDPRTVDREYIRQLAATGFNRLSLGVQDFNPAVQRAVNRVQSYEEIECLVSGARETGFESVSFDLIYGLPKQTDSGFQRTLDQVCDLRPDRLAIYNYAHLPERFKGQRMINSADLPDPATKLRILEQTIMRLADAGYVYIGMDHFALPDDELAVARRDGTLQRNFQGYSTRGNCDLVGLGVSSIGAVGDVYAQNVTTTAVYEQKISAGQLAISKGIRIDSEDRIRGAVIQDLMCFDKLDFSTFNNTHSIDFEVLFAPELARLQPLVRDGLVATSGESIRVLPKGRLLLRNIAMVFDRYLGDDETRYSKAI